MIALYIIVMIILVFFSMCFSSADMAYSAVSTVRLENYIKEKNSKVAKLALDLTKNYEMTIATLLLGNNLVNIGLTSIMTIFLIQLVNSNVLNLTQSVATTLGSLLVLVILLICGEIVPKSIVKSKTFRASLLFAYFTKFFSIIFFPFVFIFSGLGKAISYPITKNARDIKLTDKELEEMVDSLNEEKIIDVNQAEILKGTIDYASTEAYEIMTPRVNIMAIDIDDDEKESYFENEELFNFSRIPVYQDSIDNIIGYVLTKTLVRRKLENKPFNLDSILIEPLRFPRSTEINTILTKFKATHNHFAVIYDEYGGVEGIVTMEDILEEIVGEIWDESDEKNEPYIKLKNGNYIVNGNMNLEDFCDLFDIDYEEINTEYVTIGGYCIELLDDNFAKVNDEIKFKNLDMKILAVDENNTVLKIKIKVNKNEDD